MQFFPSSESVLPRVCWFACVFLWWILACGRQRAESSSSSSSVRSMTLNCFSSLFTSFFFDSHSTSSPIHLHISPSHLSIMLALLFHPFFPPLPSSVLQMTSFVCRWVWFFFFLPLSISWLSFLLTLRALRSPFSIFWVNLPSSLCRYLYFIYYSLQLPFSFFSPLFTPTPISLAIQFLPFGLPLSLKQHWDGSLADDNCGGETHLPFSLFSSQLRWLFYTVLLSGWLTSAV